MSKKTVPANAQIDPNLLAFIAHETRGPFNGLIGFSELLHSNRTSLSSEQQDSYTELIHQLAVKSFLQLQTLIVWVKLISNNLSIHPGVIILHEWIQHVVSSLEVDFTSKNILVNISHFPRDIKGDQQLLSIALANLLYTSLRYIDEHSELNIDYDENTNSILISTPYSKDFELLLTEVFEHQGKQNEQNFRIWIASHIFSLHGIQLKSSMNTDKNLLITSLHLSA